MGERRLGFPNAILARNREKKLFFPSNFSKIVGRAPGAISCNPIKLEGGREGWRKSHGVGLRYLVGAFVIRKVRNCSSAGCE